MEINNWPFYDNPNVMVITTKNIINKKSPILIVLHDADDAMWQFLDGSDIVDEDAAIVSLEEIFNIDNTIKEVADLQLGSFAWREQANSDWIKQSENMS
ncbi:MAG: hypothetical protein AAGU14_09475 [Eubacteriaceae bacterium]